MVSIFYLCLQVMPCCIGQRKRLNKQKHSRSVPSLLQSPAKRVKRKRTNKQTEAAMRAVKCESGINRAVVEHGMPHTTLKDRLSGQVVQDI